MSRGKIANWLPRWAGPECKRRFGKLDSQPVGDLAVGTVAVVVVAAAASASDYTLQMPGTAEAFAPVKWASALHLRPAGLVAVGAEPAAAKNPTEAQCKCSLTVEPMQTRAQGYQGEVGEGAVERGKLVGQTWVFGAAWGVVGLEDLENSRHENPAQEKSEEVVVPLE